MSRRATAWLAWSVWTMTFALLALQVPPVNVGDGPLAVNLLGTVVLLAYATAGALIASRQPRNAIGWLLADSALLSALGDLALEYAIYGLITRPGALAAPAWAALIGEGVRSVGFFLVLTFLLLLFPTGHLPSPRWRALAWVTLASIALFCAANLLAPDLSSADQRLSSFASPFDLGAAVAAVDGLVTGVSLFLVLGCAFACSASVVVRFRRAQGIERQQLKWLVYAALWAALAFFAAWVGVFINNPILASAATFDLCLLGIPVAVGIAILRHGLFDIDLIINRTLVYGSLSAVLAVVYFACVIGAQSVTTALTGQKNTPPVVIVATTLLIAAVFNPLRRRIQVGIDRRFYRHKYDAERTLAAFSATLRTETDLTGLTEHLVGIVTQTMQPAHVSLLLRPHGASRVTTPGSASDVSNVAETHS